MSLMLGFKHMALYKQSGGDTIAKSGKVAGTVYAVSGSAGPFIRVWAKPRNRRTALQTAVRGNLSGLSSSWRALAIADIEAWNQAATGNSSLPLRVNVFGDQRKCTGAQLYIRVNGINLEVGNALYTTPPVSGTTDAIIAAAGTADASAQTFTIQVTTFGGAVVVPANTVARVYATSQQSSGRSFFGASQYRFLSSYAAAVSINPLSITADYIAKFGALVAGSRIGIKIDFVFDDGAGTWSKGGDVYTTVTVVP